MIDRIALVRHGRSSHVHTGWVDAAGLRAWREAYEAAGIRDDESVPAALRAIIAPGALVLASDAIRAVASARLIAGGRDVTVSPFLRELTLDAPALGGLRLPLSGWAMAIATRFFARSLRGREISASEASRIADAAKMLDELASEHPLIIAVTHGGVRRMLGARLVEAGWQPEKERRTHRHWSAWMFRRQHDRSSSLAETLSR